MSPNEAVAEALAFLAGQHGTDAAHVGADAAVIVDRLARFGFAVVLVPDVARGRYSPEQIRAKRESLKLAIKALAREAGLDEKTVRSIERPGSRSHRLSVDIVSATLDRLGGIEAAIDAEPLILEEQVAIQDGLEQI